jgi:hypothetical protein
MKPIQWANPLGADRQFVDPQFLSVRQESRPEVGSHQELVELHLGEVGGSQHHVGVFDDELPVEPATNDAVPVWAVILKIQGIELEVRLDAVPLVVLEEHVLAVVELPVVAALERPLGQAVGHVLVLDVLGSQPQFAADRLDVEREVAGGGTVPLRILGGHEVRQVGMEVLAAPAPALGELQVETDAHLVRRHEQASDRRRAFHA